MNELLSEGKRKNLGKKKKTNRRKKIKFPFVDEILMKVSCFFFPFFFSRIVNKKENSRIKIYL